MENRRRILNEFLEKLFKLERELDNLDSFAYDISQLYNLKVFPEQEELSTNTLENLMTVATHEVSSEIGFYRNDIENLTKLIEYREKYNKLTDVELSEILDGNVSIKLKQSLSTRFETVKSMTIYVNRAIQEWNEAFENKNYSKLKKQLRI